jgi:hypothetical protein
MAAKVKEHTTMQFPTPMDDLPKKATPPPAQPTGKPTPKRLKKAPKRAKRPASQAQRSRVARTNAKEAPRDEQGRFASKHPFEYVFDGIEWLVGRAQKTHKKLKRTARTVRRVFKQQPRMVPTRQPRRRRRVAKKKSEAQAQYRRGVMRGLFSR